MIRVPPKNSVLKEDEMMRISDSYKATLIEKQKMSGAELHKGIYRRVFLKRSMESNASAIESAATLKQGVYVTARNRVKNTQKHTVVTYLAAV